MLNKPEKNKKKIFQIDFHRDVTEEQNDSNRIYNATSKHDSSIRFN